MNGVIRALCTAVIVLLPFHVLIRLLFTAPETAFWKETLIAVGVVLAAARLLGGVPASRFRGVPLLPLLLFVAMAGIWAVARGDTTAVYGFAGYGAYSALFLLVVLAFEGRDAPRLAWLLIVPAFIVAIGGVIQVFWSPTLWGLTLTFALPGSDQVRVSSLLGSTILLAPYLAYAIILAVGETLAARRADVKLALLVMIGVMLFALVHTWSRGGWLQLVIAGALLVLLMVAYGPARQANLLVQRVALAGAVLILALPLIIMTVGVQADPTALAGRAASTLDFTTDAGNVERLRTWVASWEFVGRSPGGLLIGIGPGEGWYFQNIDRFGQSAYTNWMSANGVSPVTESWWLLLLLNLGVLGLGLFLYAFGALLLGALRALPDAADSRDFVRRAALLANLGSAVVALSWLQSLTSVHVAMVVWVQVGMLIITTRDNAAVADEAAAAPEPAPALQGAGI
jgi:O-antigen ligase